MLLQVDARGIVEHTGSTKGLQGRFPGTPESIGLATPEPGLHRPTDLVWSAGLNPVAELSLILWVLLIF